MLMLEVEAVCAVNALLLQCLRDRSGVCTCLLVVHRQGLEP